MQKSFFSLITFACFCAAGLPLTADSVAEISQKHYEAMLQDLSTYIAANPNAEDLGEARMKAVEAAFYADNKAAMLPLLQDQFNDLKSQDPIPAQELAQTGMMMVQFSTEQGNTEIPKEVLKTFKELAENGDGPIFAQVYAQLDAQMNKPGVGTSPELSGTTLDGKKISLEDYKGKVVMIDFWATWCGPCIAEMPNVKKAYAKYHDKGFEIIGVSLDRSLDPLKKYIADNEITWPQIYDNDQTASLADQFSITSIPSIFILDKTGKIISVNARGPELEKVLAEYLGE